MSKYKYLGEYKINASKNMLYPYLSTANGLRQWFADDVSVDAEGLFTMVWDGEKDKARVVSQHLNTEVKFEFIGEEEDPSYLEFQLDMNDITQEVFVKVTDYSTIDDLEELEELWNGLIAKLREIVGG